MATDTSSHTLRRASSWRGINLSPSSGAQGTGRRLPHITQNPGSRFSQRGNHLLRTELPQYITTGRSRYNNNGICLQQCNYTPTARFPWSSSRKLRRPPHRALYLPRPSHPLLVKIQSQSCSSDSLSRTKALPLADFFAYLTYFVRSHRAQNRIR